MPVDPRTLVMHAPLSQTQYGDVASVPAGPQQNAPWDRHCVPQTPKEQPSCRFKRVSVAQMVGCRVGGGVMTIPACVCSPNAVGAWKISAVSARTDPREKCIVSWTSTLRSDCVVGDALVVRAAKICRCGIVERCEAVEGWGRDRTLVTTISLTAPPPPNIIVKAATWIPPQVQLACPTLRLAPCVQPREVMWVQLQLFGTGGKAERELQTPHPTSLAQS
jgi:hypothetical protein